jgi:hypothetical protein
MAMLGRSARSASRKSRASRTRSLRSEWLEPRELLSVQSWSWRDVTASYVAKTVNAAPTVAQAISANNNSAITGKTASLSVLGKDDGGEAKLTYNWSASAVPSGASISFSANGSNAAKKTAITFSKAGNYTLAVKITDAAGLSVTSSKSVVVSPSLTTIVVTPGTATVTQGAKQQFAARGLDQFQQALASQPAFAWSAVSGAVSSSGLYTASGSLGKITITAKSGSVSGTATATVVAGSGGLQTAALAQLVQSLDADGAIGRQDMIQILRSVGGDGVVNAAELSDLKAILNQATTLNIPGYVLTLAGDVVNGNAANAKYQGQSLGNLAAGSSSTQLNKLVDKWFLGVDLPTLTSTSYIYKQASGSLFPHAPSHIDEFQGQLGDCYFISALGTIADANPAAIQNMFLDNGDGTYTVRFYTGNYGSVYDAATGTYTSGFSNGVGTADYVTVNRMLPANSSGRLVYADYGAAYNNTANSLWIPLAEKAYAQWNETGKEARDGKNAYASIEGGWMGTVDAQVLGHNVANYALSNSTKQAMVNALAGKKAVTIGTKSSLTTSYGLYACHAYAVIGYTAATDTFTLYNPWGCYQPGQLSWSQIVSTCDLFTVADATGSTTISGGSVRGSQSDQRVAAVFASSPSSPDQPVHPNGGLSPALVDAILTG